MSALPRPLPSNRDENWKYANLRGLARARFDAAPPPAPALVSDVAAMLPPPLPGFPRIVLVDGHPLPALSASPPEASFRAGAVDVGVQGNGDVHVDHYFADLNRRSRAATCLIEVAAGQSLALEVICVTTASGHPALDLRLGADAELTLVERQLGLRGDAAGLGNLHLQATLAQRARLVAARIGHHEPRTQWLETLELDLGEAASAKVVQLMEGGAASRSTALVELAGRDAALEWHVAALGEGTQCHDAYARINHAAPGTRTRQTYRGIAAGRSRIAFNGHMRVAQQASGARTDQSLKCLLAGSEAEADARPQLEIHTDAVQASHGATVGMLDPDMLFYLLSRGIPPAAAESLLKWAFVSDVLAHLPSPALRAQVEAALERQLPGAAAARQDP
ncbi:MAG: SufD family Fe-S cluster assembly protein [Gammaproteobacteria bacterium]|nr:SufD family Fe-S cluster assembly protein [Gammaproteobacteria bacterium]